MTFPGWLLGRHDGNTRACRVPCEVPNNDNNNKGPGGEYWRHSKKGPRRRSLSAHLSPSILPTCGGPVKLITSLINMELANEPKDVLGVQYRRVSSNLRKGCVGLSRNRDRLPTLLRRRKNSIYGVNGGATKP